jgi:hypothetical protein
VLIVSDGAASQFKNRFIFKSLCTVLPQTTKLSFEWHFSATSHGKGACDAVGGRAKREVAKQVRSSQVIVNTAEVRYVLLL